jgi:3-hydroxybutyrate dehydrogenase
MSAERASVQSGGSLDRQLEGRVALVTGAGGTLGRAVSDLFRQRGAAVVGADLVGEDVYRCDISTADGNRELIAAVIESHGRLDVLVLNAGIQHVAPIGEFPEEQWDRLLGAMLKGPFLTIREAWPHLTARPGGRILVTASTCSFAAERFKAAYVSAKHGVVGLVKVAALEGAEHQLTANAVAPSWMRTPMVEKQVAEQARLRGLTEAEVIAGFVEKQAEKRFVEPLEVAETLAFLASPAASAITGSCIPVDIGALA